MSCCTPSQFISPDRAMPGDVIVLTKPIGTQLAVNLNEWSQLEDLTKWNKALSVLSVDDAIYAYKLAVTSMIRLNRNAAKLMHKYEAHGATDVTGFGILGHARNLALHQKEKVDFVIESLPVINKMHLLHDLFPGFKLLQGFSAETSGGLLIILSPDKAKDFCTELESIDGASALLIGHVVQSSNPKNTANIVSSPNIISV